ncbi:MltR family transcriptional regulator [Maribacter sp. PR1]|uniref:MltR family transcriptional regulator n=1 Tax=Maribacter cobaltidurans TaxID=1178778 RepID=A0ABU7IZU3_9FLAO|nr:MULTISPECIES: MltR family transcriptional regulator [Maribacter]MDC6390966.1 MltR family transcriptional regulator [Maribacter sp. PR1]MEE1978358.1 MltR family transcriptional regulator [Maribacter cobaltidurans]
MNDNPKVDIFSKFLKEFQDETDRGASIMAGSILDEKLKTILYDFLIDCKQTKDLIDGYGAPIGTFSSRLNLAFSLGLISEHEFQDCNTIRKIRNEFAHKFEMDFSFEDQKIKSLCWNLNAPTPRDKETFKDKPRLLFVNGVTMLYLNWLYREEYVSKRKLERPNWKGITWMTKE